MVFIPPSVAQGPLLENGRPVRDLLIQEGFTPIHQGKVRDTYTNPFFRGKRIVLATDRISIFDFVLPAEVPFKGEVLTALTHFWAFSILKSLPTHAGSSVRTGWHWLRTYVPDAPWQRMLVVEDLKMQAFELIFRGYIGGSVWREYQNHGTAGGNVLPPNLQRWQKLPQPIFTPSTKAAEGHDVNITAAEYHAAMGQEGHETIAMLDHAYHLIANYAATKGILLLDTKFEVGIGQNPTQIVIADEIGTPDSSRFTTVQDWEAAMLEGRDPIFLDKEPVRNWGRQVETPFGKAGLQNLDPTNPNHCDFVGQLVIPPDVLEECTQRYLKLFEDLVGVRLGVYQQQMLTAA